MAKGDDRRMRGDLDYQGKVVQNNLDNLRGHVLRQNYSFTDDYNNARNIQMQDYGNIMGEYDNFSKTGGYSEEDKANIRARSVAPIRSAYAGANREVDRNLARQGGFVPGFNAAKAKLARESSYAMSDAATNAEGMLAQMVNEGKRFGTAGKTNLYGSTPGMWNAAANHLLSSSGQMLGIEGLQGDYFRNIMGARQGLLGAPGTSQQVMGNILTGARIGGGILGGWM